MPSHPSSGEEHDVNTSHTPQRNLLQQMTDVVGRIARGITGPTLDDDFADARSGPWTDDDEVD